MHFSMEQAKEIIHSSSSPVVYFEGKNKQPQCLIREQMSVVLTRTAKTLWTTEANDEENE